MRFAKVEAVFGEEGRNEFIVNIHLDLELDLVLAYELGMVDCSAEVCCAVFCIA